MTCRYVHMVEPRANELLGGEIKATDSLAPFRAIWRSTFVSAGGHDQVRRPSSFEDSTSVFKKWKRARPGNISGLLESLGDAYLELNLGLSYRLQPLLLQVSAH